MITDLIFQQPDADEPVSLAQLINRINSTHRYTKNRILKQQSKFTKRTVNRAHKFADGDDVWIARNFPGTKRTGTNKSFFWPFRPDVYEITEVLSPQTLRVRRKATNTRAHGKSEIMHTRRVKPCRPQVDAFDYADMSISEFEVCDLSFSTFRRADLTDTLFGDTTLTCTEWTQARRRTRLE